MRVWITALALVAAAAGCSPGPGRPDPDLSDGPLPVFSLHDENPTSATYDQDVATDSHLGHVSAWYFGHAT